MRVLAIVMCALMILPVVASGRTWYVKPDSTGDAPTIQAAIDSAAASDTVLVSAGAYTEPAQSHDFGPSMLIMKSGVTLMGEAGMYSNTLDAESAGRVILCPMLASQVTIEGFQIRGGAAFETAPSADNGAGILCRGSSARIRNCEFVDNHSNEGGAISFFSSGDSSSVVDCAFYDNSALDRAGAIYNYWHTVRLERCVFINNTAGSGGGGAVYCQHATLAVLYCDFLANSAPGSGGALCCYEASPSVNYSTFYYNNAVSGAITCKSNSSPQVSTTIIAGSTVGAGLACTDGTCSPILLCCDIYGNAGGDYTGCIADQFAVDGNFSADPLFCDIWNGDFSVEACSPCLPGNNPYGAPPGCGSHESGCGCGEATEPVTWGSIKALYR